jgi:hypothetical protein
MLVVCVGRINRRIRTMSLETIAWPAVTPFRQLREDPEFYIPDYIGGYPDGMPPDLYAAADDHARDLRKAEKHLDDAYNLAGVLRASLQEAGDSRALQADTVLKIIEKLLTKAHRCIDRHDTRFMNLFMAYFDSKEEGSAPGDT